MTLTGTTTSCATVSITRTTRHDGTYAFTNLRPGTYRVTESQPGYYTDGKDTLGNLGGSKPSNDVLSVTIGSNAAAVNYNFGELTNTGCSVSCCDTGSTAFWRGIGQGLLLSLNGSSNATNLGSWLATNFPNLFGSSSGSSLYGKTNAQVANAFNARFGDSARTVEAQAMASAFAIYASSSSLSGGSYASAFGFHVTTSGIASRNVNVAGAGSSLGLSNNATTTLMDSLRRTDSRSSAGVFNSGSSSARSAVRGLFDMVNDIGGIRI